MSGFSKIMSVLRNLRQSTNLLSVIASDIHRHQFNTSSNIYAKVPYILSDIGEGIRDVIVKEWFIKVGDKVSQFDNICEVQSDKASVTITSRYDGIVSKLYYNIDDVALVGKPLVDIDVPEDDTKVSHVNVIDPPVESHQTSPASYKKDICIPSVRRMAKEYKIDLSTIKGSGKDGRILKEDLIAYMNKQQQTEVKLENTERIEEIKGFQKVMVKTMSKSLEIPHMLLCEEINVSNLSRMRETYNKENLGIHLTLLPFFIKAISNSLVKYPILNARVDEKCENVIYSNVHNIGIAMDTEQGLAVPVIKNVQDLSLLKIGKELNRLVNTGKKGHFSPSDVTGVTFTISNIGIIAGTYLKPVIVPPQLGIIAIGAKRLLPRYDSNMNLTPQEILNISSSVDHRIVDGATLARFIKDVKKQLENPNLIFLQL